MHLDVDQLATDCCLPRAPSHARREVRDADSCSSPLPARARERRRYPGSMARHRGPLGRIVEPCPRPKANRSLPGLARTLVNPWRVNPS